MVPQKTQFKKTPLLYRFLACLLLGFGLENSLVFAQNELKTAPTASDLPVESLDKAQTQSSSGSVPATKQATEGLSDTQISTSQNETNKKNDSLESNQMVAPKIENTANVENSLEQGSLKNTQKKIETKEILAIREKLKTDPRNLALIEELGKNLYRRGHNEEAIATLKPHSDTLSADALLVLARAFNRNQDYLNEVRVLKHLLTIKPEHFSALTQLGFYFVKHSDNPMEGAEHFRKAIQVKKNFRPAYEGLIEIYEKKENRYELRILYQDMIKVFGEKPAYLEALCKLNALDSFFEAASSYCNKGIILDGNNANNHVYLGIVQKNSGNFEQAIKILKKAASSFEQSEFAQAEYAKLLFEQKNFLLAEKYFAQATRANPKGGLSWLGHAQSAMELDDYEKAVESFRLACQTNPNETTRAIKIAGIAIRKKRQDKWDEKLTHIQETCVEIHKAFKASQKNEKAPVSKGSTPTLEY